MNRFKFELNTYSMRKFGLYQIAVTVPRKELKKFIVALKKLRADPREHVVIMQDGFPKSLTLQRFSRLPRKREWSSLKETENGYVARLFDDDLEPVLDYYVDWLNHKLPAYGGEKVGVKLNGGEIDLYFTQDAPGDRIG